ncbi:NAD-dependent epimerase/dehydratase family protein [Promicromonospora sp. Populi]|uniref:NAD-dependent epimerase/dehydratase family protein n=1 Tax=Promicromonospora sp. Populi TaxID=3239420 RepID=UPI0034E1CFD0
MTESESESESESETEFETEPVLVTGATGLLGSSVVRRLVELGRPVTVLARDAERAARLLPSEVRVVVGDTVDPDVWDKVLPDVGSVVHAAAYFREFYQPGADPHVLYETNVTALGRLLAAAERHDIRTVVHVSSTAALAKGGVSAPADEESPPPADAVNGYAASKVAAEAVVQAHVAHGRGPAVPLVLPGWMWGPGDSGPTSSGRLFLSIARGELPVLPDVGNSMVDARDVAEVCVRVLDAGISGMAVSGRRYIAAGRWERLRDLAAVIASETGRRAPRALPGRLTIGLASAVGAVNRLTGREDVANRAGVEVLVEGDKARVSSDRVRQELGIEFRPAAETLRDEAAWYRAEGLL